jgi:EAL domain-containing protein (putative c-di-GMP-specific phosphodiesterase class I)
MTNGKAGITMRSSLELAHDLGMDTMVSGIEDEGYYKMIKDADCDYATGNYFYEQLDAEGFIALVNGSERKEEEA